MGQAYSIYYNVLLIIYSIYISHKLLYDHKIILKLPKRYGQHLFDIAFREITQWNLRVDCDSPEISFLLIRTLRIVVWNSCVA